MEFSWGGAWGAEEAAGDASQGSGALSASVRYFKGLDFWIRFVRHGVHPRRQEGRPLWPPSLFTPQSLLFLEAELSGVLGLQ